MTYARARRRAMRDPWYTNRCYGCYHLNTPEWAPFCSAFCHNAWSARVLEDEHPAPMPESHHPDRPERYPEI